MDGKNDRHSARNTGVVFEDVVEQYVKGRDVTVSFTVSNEIEVNPDEDQIGLTRV